MTRLEIILAVGLFLSGAASGVALSWSPALKRPQPIPAPDKAPAGPTRSRVHDTDRGRREPPGAAVAHAAPEPEAPDRAAFRAMQDAVEASEDVGEHNLDAYLDGLERQARARGHVAAEDVEPGLVALRRLHPRDEKTILEFETRMIDLSAELSGTEPEPEPSWVQVDIAAERIRSRSDSEAIEAYIHATQSLPEEADRLAAMEELELLVGSP